MSVADGRYGARRFDRRVSGAIAANGKLCLIIPFTTVLAFATLYLPQPILPLLAGEFYVTEPEAALLTAGAMAPLGIVPIFYGYLADRISAKRLLRVAVGLLAVNELLLAVAPTFALMLALRFAQGLVLPAVFTSLITYSANAASPERVRNAVNLYIGASIIGGFSGRLLGGFVSEFVHWRAAFGLLTLLLGIAWIALGRLRSDTRPAPEHIGIRAVREVLGRGVYRNAYFGIFLVFFVFASLLNYVPFRLKTIDPMITESTIALVYVGYLCGALIALNGVRITRWLGGELRGVFLGIVLLTVGVIGMTTTSLAHIFLYVFLMCAGFFLIHSLLTAFLNHRALSGKGVVNGLYIAFYYSGGALGGWLPGYLYRNAGWEPFIFALASLLAVAGWWLWRMRQAAAGLPSH
jgi:YNFM family putative membrane transporter